MIGSILPCKIIKFTLIHSYIHRNDHLRLCVADYLTQVIACHCKCVAIAITELGATDLCVCHTLVVQMCNLRRYKDSHEIYASRVFFFFLHADL